MAWIQIDDHFDEHPKLQAIGPAAWGMWLAGLAYCNRNLTDGFIPWAKARSLVSFTYLGPDDHDERGRIVYELAITSGSGLAGHGEDLTAAIVIAQLLDVGLWEEVDGGYHIHDYTDWQKSKEQVLAERKASAKRQGIWRDKHKRNGASNDESNGVTNDDDNGVTNAVPQPQPQPNVLSVTKSGGSIARAPAKESPPLPKNGSSYATTLNGALPKLESLFQELDKDLFTPAWLSGVLVEAERTIGPLSRDQLGRGLNVALKQMRNKMAGTPPTSPRPYARKLIVDYLTEQRDDHHAA
jgi:hypothetical protein